MSQNTNYMMWNMTRQCNYRCSYCYYPHTPPPVHEAFPARDLLHFLDGTERQWLVGMTGGEPMLYPGFVDLCRQLTQNHRISIDTNLSLPRQVRDFVEKVDPARVEEFYVSLHIQERERNKGVNSFIESAKLLQAAGHTVIVNYVLHPDLVSRFPKDRAFFSDHGINLRPRPFKGSFNDKKYPDAYGPEAREMLSLHPGAGTKMVYDFYGLPCEGGRSFIRMEPDGTVFRCSGEKTIMGNVHTGVTLYDRAEPCRVRRCPCRGADHVLLTDAQQAFLRGLQMNLLGKLDEAHKAYDQAIDLDPMIAAAHNNTGVLLWNSKHHDQALRAFAKASAQQPGEPLFICNTALALAAQGKKDEACQTCRNYLASFQDSSVSELCESLQRTLGSNGTALNAPRLCMRVHPAD